MNVSRYPPSEISNSLRVGVRLSIDRNRLGRAQAVAFLAAVTAVMSPDFRRSSPPLQQQQTSSSFHGTGRGGAGAAVQVRGVRHRSRVNTIIVVVDECHVCAVSKWTPPGTSPCSTTSLDSAVGRSVGLSD